MTLTTSWPSSVYVAFIALVIPVSGLWAEEDASLPASQDKGISFNRPELPRLSVDTRTPEHSERLVEVPDDGDFQQAVDDARPGDTIVLQAGATYTGTFVFPKKDGVGWIVVKSSAESHLPPPGTRVTPADSKHMPKIVTARNVQPSVRTEHGAHHYRFIGIEFTTASEVERVSAIVEVSHRSTELDDVPSHFVFDRVYIHGNPELNSQRGLAMNSRWTAVIDSWIDECHIHGFDSQAICTWNGPGPFKMENCFLEGGSENIMFGESRLVEVIENEGQFPLLGVGLLRERRLTVDYRSRTLAID